MVSKEKATAAMMVELVSITPVHLYHIVTANIFTEYHRKYCAPWLTNEVRKKTEMKQKCPNFISVASDPLKVLNVTVTSRSHIRLEKRQYASHFELNYNSHAGNSWQNSKSQRLSGAMSKFQLYANIICCVVAATNSTCFKSHRQWKHKVVVYFYFSPLLQLALNKIEVANDHSCLCLSNSLH